MHYLKAVKAAAPTRPSGHGEDEGAAINDFMTKNGRIREDAG